MKLPTPPPDDEAQSRRFIDTAKELGADQDSAEFDKAMEAVKSAKGSKPAEAPARPSAKKPSR